LYALDAAGKTAYLTVRSHGKYILVASAKRGLLLIALAGFLRLFGLDSESIWMDEAFSVVWAKKDLMSLDRSTAAVETHPPLYYILLHLWMLAFGQSEAAIRSLSACLGLVSVLLLYKVGRELFNREVGLVASFLLTISAFSIWLSQDARPYSLLLLLTLLSFFLFIKTLKVNKPG
jgi:uncharacterized membrane protein